MRVHVYSDLHLEFGPLDLPADVCRGRLAELVLLAGDIHVEGRAPHWAATTFSRPVALIQGNHESYGDSLTASLAAQRKLAGDATKGRPHPVRALERETWTLEAADGTPVRIVAATLWTDFALFGTALRAEMMDAAHQRMNDFRMIRIADESTHEPRPLNPLDLLRLHRESLAFLSDELAKPFDGISIVMTHHAPSRRSVPEDFGEDPVSAAYASDLDAFIEETQPQLWVHGHIHTSHDYMIGGTRVICNPRGYVPFALNPGFDPALVVEIRP